METHFWIALAASLVAASITTLGIYITRYFEAWGRNNTAYFSCFAAGVLISASFLHIIPESFSMTAPAPYYLLAGYFSMYLINRFITVYVCDKPTRKEFFIGLTPLFGIGLHSFIDGMVYSITYNVSAFTGILATAGLILHEFPEGVVTYLLLIRAGISKKSSVMLAFFAAALTTPLGMLVSFPFISEISSDALGALLALSAGALVYVGASHLLPHAEKEQRKYTVLTLAAGILIAVLITLFEHH